MNTSSEISVVLPVYNAEKYLAESIDSVINQTFSDFELIIINDGSTDSSAEVVKRYNDSRIRYIEQLNMGLAATLNKGVQLAKSPLIARMDNDDVNYPQRFEKQVSFFRQFPQAGLLGTAAAIINEHGHSQSRFLKHPTGNAELKFSLCFNNPFVHSSVMFKKEIFERAGGYSVNSIFFEDHNLWSKMASFCEINNLPDVLLKYREVSTSMSRTTADYSQRVINQCVDNIAAYCPEFSKVEIQKAVAYINGLTDSEHQHYGKKIKGLLTELGEAILRKNPGAENEINIVRKRYVKNYKRHFLNSIIESEKSSPAEKIIAKLKRKILFLTHSF